MIQLLHGDCRDILPTLPKQSVQTVITSPPYWGLRDYGVDGQIGQEESVQGYIDTLVAVFRAAWCVLRDDGTLWLNLGDSYAAPTKWGGASSGKNSAAAAVYPRSRRGQAGFVAHDQAEVVDAPHRRPQPGLKPKDLIGMPWRVALALQADGWYLRSDIIWSKPNGMPESVDDRPTKSHEYLFLLTKNEQYYYDSVAIADPTTTTKRPQYRRAIELAHAGGLTAEHISAIRAVGITDTGKPAVVQTGTGQNAEHIQRLADEAKQVLGGYYREFLPAEAKNRRSVWTIAPQPYDGAHFATFPEALVEPCILASSRPGDTVLDPFAGTFTVGRVALRYGRRAVGIELNPRYCELADERTNGVQVSMEALL